MASFGLKARVNGAASQTDYRDVPGVPPGPPVDTS
jgi:hypothetical protein